MRRGRALSNLGAGKEHVIRHSRRSGRRSMRRHAGRHAPTVVMCMPCAYWRCGTCDSPSRMVFCLFIRTSRYSSSACGSAAAREGGSEGRDAGTGLEEV